MRQVTSVLKNMGKTVIILWAVLYLLPVLNPKSYDGNFVGWQLLVLGRQ